MPPTIKHTLTALFTCLALFSLLLFFTHPIYSSGDDVYLLYLLGGGFGDPPTALLHYNYGMHPWIGYIIKNLFIKYPHTNWYSWMLYFFHFSACYLFLQLLLTKRKIKEALLIFFLLFAVFEVPFLLRPSFTNTALVLAIAGVQLLLNNNGKKGPFAFAVFVIALSTMIRFHTLVPVILVSLPVIVNRMFFQKNWSLLFPLLACTVIIFLLNYRQQQYYQDHIPGWNTEETYRQTVIDYYNIPKKNLAPGLPGSTELIFLNKGLFWDKQFLSADKIKEAINTVHVPSAMATPGFTETLKWLFIETRIYWLTLLVLLIALGKPPSKKTGIVHLLCFGILVGLLAWLFLFKKLPFYLVSGLVLFYVLLLYALAEEKKYFFTPLPALRKITVAIMVIALFAWAGRLAEKMNDTNQKQNREFVCAWQQTNSHPEKLFIVTDDHFPTDFCAVWDAPQNFPFKNLLYKDIQLNNTQQSLLNRFQISSPKDFLRNTDILFAGDTLPAIPAYYKQRWNSAVHFSPPDTGFSCLQVCRLIADSTGGDTIKVR